MILFCFTTGSLSGQVSINFENGDLNNWVESTPGHWMASPVTPINGGFSLHHSWDSPDPSHDQISLAIPALHIDKGSTTWRFRIRHGYPPSSANNWAVFLIADHDASDMTPDGNLNAYVLGVNFKDSDDLVKLWKCSGGLVAPILTTGYNWQDNVSVDSSRAFEIGRTKTGLWTLKTGADYNHLASIGQITDNSPVIRGFFGIYYKYSLAQDRKLWFDDLFIDGSFIPDTLPPKIQSVTVIGPNLLSLELNEPVQHINQTDTQYFFVDQNIGKPETVSSSNQKVVTLKFGKAFQEEVSYLLTVDGLEDLSGNKMHTDTVSFLYYIPKPYDVVINEIMPDPSPPVGLPESEYIELKNSCAYSLSLNSWSLQVEEKNKEIPSIDLFPGDYLILCSESDTAAFSKFGKVAGINGFPVLLNNGGNVNIQDSTGVVISSIFYSPDWYKDAVKAEGGWALEQIDANAPCQGAANWKASIDFSGGTPGRKNSVAGLNPDPDPPELTHAFVENDSIVIACFNEPYNRQLALDLNLYEVDLGVGKPVHAEAMPPDFTSIKLIYPSPFQPLTIYTLMVYPPFSDCSGNIIGAKNFTSFGIPSTADSLDLVINEVLFHPRPGGVDFVEIYNRSAKLINLTDIRIATKDPDTWELTSVYPVSNTPLLLVPGAYLAMTTAPEVLMDQYPENNAGRILDLSHMPALPANEGVVVLTTKWLSILDEFGYDEGMHFPLLNSTVGVSLERIQPDKPTMDPTNWHSAAEDIGFATPGLQNSQFLSNEYTQTQISVDPEIFSPDNDGYNDVVRLNYHFDEPGYVADIMVFDANGHLVRKLANNELLGAEGYFFWDGINETGVKAPVGIYLFFVKVFNLKGRVMAYKVTCVLARRFN